MENELIIKQFEGQEVGFRVNNSTGQSEVKIEAIAKFCGWVTKAKSGNECIRWSRVNEKLKSLGVAKVGNGDFIPENIMYPLIGMADFTKNQKARDFMLWVGKVLTELRQNGMYIMDNATDEQKTFNYKLLDITFKNCSIEKLDDLYNECLSYYKNNRIRIPMKKHKNHRSDKKLTISETKLRVMQKIKNTIEERSLGYEENKQFALSSICDDVVKNIMKDTSELKQRISGGQKSAKTKLIKELQPKNEEYMVVNIHPMSNNYLYTHKYDKWLKKDITVKTDTYKNWIYKFPKHQLKDKNKININWNKPIKVFLKFDCLDKFDSSNFVKATIDEIITRIYHEDDNIVEKVICEKNKSVDKYKDGKIYICIKNI